MALLVPFIFKLSQLIIIYFYPGYKVIKTAEQKDLQKLWIIYFLIVGILAICEETILFPFIIIIGKISPKIYPIIKTLFHLWLYYPEYRGALLIDQIKGDLIDKIYRNTNPLLGRAVSFLGIVNRGEEISKQKNE